MPVCIHVCAQVCVLYGCVCMYESVLCVGACSYIGAYESVCEYVSECAVEYICMCE